MAAKSGAFCPDVVDAHWVESAKGLGNAYMRMKELGPRIATATS